MISIPDADNGKPAKVWPKLSNKPRWVIIIIQKKHCGGSQWKTGMSVATEIFPEKYYLI